MNVRRLLSPRQRSLALPLLCTLALAVPALGQDPEADPGAVDDAPSDYNPTADSYTVQTGDTLWDISAKVVGSPFQWPRVWAYNPEVTNPHWIYPGDVIRFHPSDQELPRLVDLVADKREIPEPVVEPTPAPELVRKTVDVVDMGPRRPPSRRRGLVSLLLTSRELAESGTLTNAPDDKILLAPQDEVFITFPRGKKGAPGQRYMVFRTAQEVRHPLSGERWGYITEVTGFASIQASDAELSRARLDETLLEVERGQLVAPAVELPRADQAPKPAKRNAAGVIVAIEPMAKTMVARGQIVFVDIGQDSGLEVGNRLVVFKRGDPLHPRDRDVPWTEVGRLLVVDVKERSATTLAVGSRMELVPGMPVRAITQ